MKKFETTINTLKQLEKKIYQEDWEIFRILESEDNRYTIALNEAISCIKVLDQIRWERDIATEQLHELGLGLGQKIDGIYLTHDKYNELLEYKYMYEDLCK